MFGMTNAYEKNFILFMADNSLKVKIKLGFRSDTIYPGVTTCSGIDWNSHSVGLISLEQQ